MEERMSKRYSFYVEVKENNDIVEKTVFRAGSYEQARRKVLDITLERVHDAFDICPLWTKFPAVPGDVDIVGNGERLMAKAVASWVDQGWTDYELREQLTIEVVARPGNSAREAYKARKIK